MKVEKFSESKLDELAEKMRLARVKLLGTNGPRYLAPALMNMYLTPTYDPNLRTMAVDKYWRCYWSPHFVDKLTLSEIAWVLVHEVNHLLRRHFNRALPYHDVWNIAADMEINDDLNHYKTVVKQPGDFQPYFPSTYGLKEGQSGEQYYQWFMKNKVKFVKMAISNGCKEDGDWVDNGQDAGSGSDGGKRSWEEGIGKDDSPAVSEVKADFIRRQVAERIREHGIGNVPGNLAQWAQIELKPKHNWKAELRNSISRAINFIRGQSYKSYKVHARRMHPDFILPGSVVPVPSVTCIIDTSGSMSTENLQDALAEVGGCLSSIPSHMVNVVTGDTQSNTKHTVRSMQEIEMVGGGGTDMGALVMQNLDTDIIIVMTDGDTPWCNPVSPKVICCLVDGDREVPSWIQKIVIPVEK